MKINLKPQKDVGKTELKLPRSGFVHPFNICKIAKVVIFSETVEKPQKLIFRASKYPILLHSNLGKLQKLDFFDSL